jgi:signal transduction histidine kinase
VKVKGRANANSATHARTKAGNRRANPSRRGQQTIHLRTLNQLVQVLSHETRNILGSFATCLELLRRSTHLNQEDRELVDILKSGSRRLNEISEQFAAFGPRPPLRLESVELAALIGDVVERLRGDERCSGTLDIHVVSDSAVRHLAADRHFLGKCLWNVFLNAVQAMGARGTLEIKTERIDGNVEIHIRDTGPGIPASLRARVFEPLFTTKPRATGLGLAIARRIAEEHGGALNLHAGQKTGSQFTLVLPLRPGSNVSVNGARFRRAGRAKSPRHPLRNRKDSRGAS